MIDPITPIAIAMALALGSLIHHRVTQAAQPLRLEMASKGEELLANEELPHANRQHLEWLLETAFGMRIVLIGAFFLVPYLALLVVVRHRFFTRLQLETEIAQKDLSSRYDEVLRLHDRITLANHPVLLPLLELWMFLLIPAAVIIRATLFKSLAVSVTYRTVKEGVEDSTIHLGRRAFGRMFMPTAQC